MKINFNSYNENLDYIEKKFNNYDEDLKLIRNQMLENQLGTQRVYDSVQDYIKEVKDLKKLLNSEEINSVYHIFEKINKISISEDFKKNVDNVMENANRLSEISCYLENLVDSIKKLLKSLKDE